MTPFESVKILLYYSYTVKLATVCSTGDYLVPRTLITDLPGFTIPRFYHTKGLPVYQVYLVYLLVYQVYQVNKYIYIEGVGLVGTK